MTTAKVQKQAAWGFLVPLAVFLLIIGVHFHGLFGKAMSESLWGISISADPIGDLSVMDERLQQLVHGCFGHSVKHDFPFGAVHAPSNRQLGSIGHVVFAALAIASNQVVWAFNAAILSLFALNFLLIYLTVQRWVKDRLLALMPTVLITFSAYAYAHSWAHLGLIATFYFACFLYTFSRLQETARARYVVASALLMTLALFSSPYYFYMMVWTAIATFVGQCCADYRRLLNRRVLLANVACVLASCALALPFAYEMYLMDYTPYWEISSGGLHFGNDLEWLLNFSARPLDYILPNTNNTFYGDFFAQFITDVTRLRHRWSDEFAVSIGIIPTLFIGVAAGIGIGFACGGRARQAVRCMPLFKAAAAAKIRHPALCYSLAILVIVAFFLSLPPFLTFGDVKVYMPNELLRHIVPFRAYSRFALLCLTALVLLMTLVAQEMRHGRYVAMAAILACGVESMPRTMLHPASKDAPYIAYLRSRPEQVIMRFESQNLERKRAIDLEVVLSGKSTLNGQVNWHYSYTDLGLRADVPKFNMGYLAAMGAELLIVSGHLAPVGKEAPYLELLATFPEDDVEVWKLLPGSDPKATALFAPFIQKRLENPCYAAPKTEVVAALEEFGRLIR